MLLSFWITPAVSGIVMLIVYNTPMVVIVEVLQLSKLIILLLTVVIGNLRVGLLTVSSTRKP